MLNALKNRFPKIEIIDVSALTGEGLETLKNRLMNLIGREMH